MSAIINHIPSKNLLQLGAVQNVGSITLEAKEGVYRKLDVGTDWNYLACSWAETTTDGPSGANFTAEKFAGVCADGKPVFNPVSEHAFGNLLPPTAMTFYVDGARYSDTSCWFAGSQPDRPTLRANGVQVARGVTGADIHFDRNEGSPQPAYTTFLGNTWMRRAFGIAKGTPWAGYYVATAYGYFWCAPEEFEDTWLTNSDGLQRAFIKPSNQAPFLNGAQWMAANPGGDVFLGGPTTAGTPDEATHGDLDCVNFWWNSSFAGHKLHLRNIRVMKYAFA